MVEPVTGCREMVMKQVRYGIIGFGGIAENRIAKEGFGLDAKRFSMNGNAGLIAAYDANSSRKHAAEALGVAWRESVDALLADPAVDAVVVATNNRSHAGLALRALQAGKHVFIEKPAGVTLREVEVLAEEAGKRRLSLGVDHMMTKNRYNVLARELLASGAIGRIGHVVLHMEFSFGMTAGEAATWRCSDRKELGGPIGDVGSHCLYMAEFLIGENIHALQCVYTPKHLGTAVEDGAIIRFETSFGTTGTIRVAFDQPRGPLAETLSNFGFEVWGAMGMMESRGTLFQLSGHDDEPVRPVLATTSEDARTVHVPKEIRNIYASQISEHAQSIISGNPMDGSEAMHNLEMVLLAHESASAGGSLKIVSGSGKT